VPSRQVSVSLPWLNDIVGDSARSCQLPPSQDSKKPPPGSCESLYSAPAGDPVNFLPGGDPRRGVLVRVDEDIHFGR